ncbi:MAG: hypothetical protein HY861_01545 [Chlamydiia bacterium]|nr:hypothetical protein [Chlamydiia bacterium]
MTLQTDCISHVALPLSIKVQPTYRLPRDYPPSFLDTVQYIMDGMLPESILSELEAAQFPEQILSTLHRLFRQLPIIEAASIDPTAGSIPVTLLCPAEFTHGVGRYIKDTFSRWLIPGKQISVVAEIGLNCYFSPAPNIKFFLYQQFIGITSDEERQEIRKNLPPLIRQMRMNIMAVYQARYVTSLRSHQRNHKTLLIQENFEALFNQTDKNLYDQAHALLSASSSEEKIDEVKKNLSHLLQTRPKTFDRDVFYEMTQFTTLISDQFAANRASKNLSRLIAYHYLFKKVIEARIKAAPQKRHLSLKISPVRTKTHMRAASILVVLNFLSQSERLELRHLSAAVHSCLSSVRIVKDSFLSDLRHGNILFMYVEVARSDGESCSIEELKQLKKNLPAELLRQVESAIHPTFMPRNEEELLRTLILLSKEIKHIRDLTQVSIHYERQTETDLIFTVLIVRPKITETPSLHQIVKNGSLKIKIDDIRILGQLKRRYAKESAVLHVSIEKNTFFRPDSSVDLLRARQKIATELSLMLGEFRDFNGGMILKQEEVLEELAELLSPLSNSDAFLLENYFYSLRPATMQTIHDPAILKTHFMMLLQNQDAESLAIAPYRFFYETTGTFNLYFVLSTLHLDKEALLNAISALEIDSYDLTRCFLQTPQFFALGCILRTDTPEIVERFEKLLKQFFNEP